MKKALKRSLSLLLAITIIFSSAYVGLSEVDFSGLNFGKVDFGELFAVKAKAATSGTCGDNLTWNLDDGTLTISGTGDMTDYGGYWSFPWHLLEKNIKTLVIDNGVTSVAKSAFREYYSLEIITLGESVKSIGDLAFYHCPALKEIFWNSKNVDDLTSESEIFGRMDTEFSNVKVVFGDTVERIPANVFNGYGRCLTSVSLGKNVTSIGEQAFYYCNRLTSITIPDNVTSIGSSAFSNCGGLQKIYWNAKCVDDFDWDSYVFSEVGENGNGVEIVFGESVERIPAYFCSSFFDLKINSISLRGNVSSIGVSAFKDTTYYWDNNNWENNVLYIDGHLIEAKPTLSREYIIKSGTLTIGDEAFVNCEDLVEITIPNTVTSIGENTFSCCSLKYIFYLGSEDDWSRVLISSANDALANAVIHYDSAGHSYNDWILESAPTCTEYGSKYKTCSICANVLTEKIMPKGHDYSTEWTIDVPPTCSEGGSKSRHCTICDDRIECLEAKATGHSYGEWVLVTKPTCTEFGIAERTCNICVQKQTSSKETQIPIDSSLYPQSEHSYPTNITKTYNFSYAGAKSLTLSFSPLTETESGFDFIFIYDANGNQYGKYSGTSLSGKVITLEGDSFEIKLTSDSCYTKYGFSFDSIVAFVEPIEEIKPLGHNYTEDWIIDNEATCTDAGSKSHHCTVCGDKTDVTVIEAVGHNYVVQNIEATHPHTTTYICTFCENTKIEKPVVSNCVECNFTIIAIDSSGYKLVSYLGTETDVVIPSNYKDNVITTIANACFRNNKTIKSVKIPNSVTSIGSLAFMSCTSLEKVYIPASVTSIGSQAFYGFTGTIYCTNGSTAHEYALANNLKFVLNSAMPIAGTENTQIDYEKSIIRTSVECADEITDVLGVSENAVIDVDVSCTHGVTELYGTGTVITVYDGETYIGDFTLIVEGDTNGDSVCDGLDAAQVALASNGHETLDGAYAMAADSNYDDIVDINDYQQIVNKAVS